MIKELRREIKNAYYDARPSLYKGCGPGVKAHNISLAKAKSVQSNPINLQLAKGKIYCGSLLGKVSTRDDIKHYKNIEDILRSIVKKERILIKKGLLPQYFTFEYINTYCNCNVREDYAYVVNFFKDNQGGKSK